MNHVDIEHEFSGFRLEHSLRKFSQSESTIIAYDKGWRAFCAWCEDQNLAPLQANSEDIAKFLLSKAVISPMSGEKPLSLFTILH